jgi:hypothetical protein
VIWWIVTFIALWPIVNLTGVADASGRPRSIWFFAVIPIAGLVWFPIGYALDRIFTPRLRRAWIAWRLSTQAGGGR